MLDPGPSSPRGPSALRRGPGRPHKHTQLICRYCRKHFAKAEHLNVGHRIPPHILALVCGAGQCGRLAGFVLTELRDTNEAVWLYHVAHAIDTKEKPFACPICRRAFGRQDSLLRHIKLHSDEREQSINPRGSTRGPSSLPDDEGLPHEQGRDISSVMSVDGAGDGTQEETLVLEDTRSYSMDASVQSTQSAIPPAHPHDPVTTASHLPIDANGHMVDPTNQPVDPNLAFTQGQMPPPSTFAMDDTLFANNGWHDDLHSTVPMPPSPELDLWQLLSGDLLPGAQSLQASPHFLESLGLATDPLFSCFTQQSVIPRPAFHNPDHANDNLNPMQNIQYQHSADNGMRSDRHEESQPIDKETGRSQEAVTEVRSLVSDLSSRITSAVSPLSTAWFELCLQMFWTRFIPTFPLMHRPTFNLRTTCAPLLLNMAAIGSLHLHGTGDPAKGIALWTLVHKAVAGSWDKLIEIRGPNDPCKGVQLLLTALLGQIFAMMSTVTGLSPTAEVFHGLGFRWAKLAGITSLATLLDHTDSDLSLSTETRWRNWAGREVLRRSIFGHYILDGCLSSLFSTMLTARHTSNLFSAAYHDDWFAARSATEWSNLQNLAIPHGISSLSDIYVELLDSSNRQISPLVDHAISSLTRQTLLEGLFSLVVSWAESGGRSAGDVDMPTVVMALCKFHRAFLIPNASDDLLIRWHHVCLTACIAVYNRDQGRLGHVLHEDIQGTPLLPSISASTVGRRALLHAAAIYQRANALPIASVTTPHFMLPGAVHAAAMILINRIVFDRSLNATTSAMTINLAESIDWSDLGDTGFVTSVGSIDASSPLAGPAFQYHQFILSGGEALWNEHKIGVHDVHALSTVLGVLGQVWPRSKAFAEEVWGKAERSLY